MNVKKQSWYKCFEHSGSVFTNYSREYSMYFSPRFANLNVTQLLSQSAVVFNLNTSINRKKREKKAISPFPTMFSKAVSC